MVLARTLTVLCACASAGPAWAQRATPQRVTDGLGDSRAPAWSPDGKWLAYESNDSGRWGLYAVAPDGGAVRILVSDGNKNRYPAWSPDGSAIAFVSNREGMHDLYTIRLADGTIGRVTRSPAEELFPAWAPDGISIWYSASLPGGIPELHSVDLRTGEVRRADSARGHGVWPRWRPDGRELAFFSRRDTDGLDDEIYLRDALSGTVHRITNRAGHDFCPAWSPDGRHLAIVSLEPGSEVRQLRVIDRDGKPVYTVGSGIPRATEPAWEPNGRRIAFSGIAGTRFAIFVQEVAGSPSR